MPKERIYAEHDPTYKKANTPNEAGSLCGIEVQWGPYPVDNDAEAGVCVGTGHLNKSELLAEDSGTEIDITFPYYVWLNRRELNRVITMLRRARRAMYGEDE